MLQPELSTYYSVCGEEEGGISVNHSLQFKDGG